MNAAWEVLLLLAGLGLVVIGLYGLGGEVHLRLLAMRRDIDADYDDPEPEPKPAVVTSAQLQSKRLEPASLPAKTKLQTARREGTG